MLLRRLRPPRESSLRTPRINGAYCESRDVLESGLLRLLSFNIQQGNDTTRYRHYVTRSWQHLLPYANREKKLQLIGDMLTCFDLVALQEVDGGSLRSKGVNQVERLATLGSFPFWHQQLNRNMGRFAQHSNGLLSRLCPTRIEDHPLPGRRGRGAMLLRFGEGKDALVVVMVHLALGKRSRDRQLSYIRELISDYRYQILMGDMNTGAEDLLNLSPLADMELVAPQTQATFPSWRPRRCLDHILVSPSLNIHRVEVLPQIISDHLPVSLEIYLPPALLENIAASPNKEKLISGQ